MHRANVRSCRGLLFGLACAVSINGRHGSTVIGRCASLCVCDHCASRGRLLLERRPAGARHAAGRLTCFGGKREPGETACGTVLRELREELSWQPRRLQPIVDLWDGQAWIARFFRPQARFWNSARN